MLRCCRIAAVWADEFCHVSYSLSVLRALGIARPVKLGLRTPLRKRDDPFGWPADHVTEDWRGVDRAVVLDDQAGNEVRSDDPLDGRRPAHHLSIDCV